MLTCEEVRALEAAYALGALEAEDEGAVREHLRRCGRHAGLVELRAASLALAFAAEEREPPAMLRERVLAGAGAKTPRRLALAKRWALGSAAALLVVAGLLAGVALLRSGDSGSEPFTKAFRTETGIEVEVAADFARPVATITFANMETLPEDETYVVWAIRDGVWLSMGRFRPNASGWWSGDFAFQLRKGDAICVTTGQPIDPYTPHGEPLFIEPL